MHMTAWNHTRFIYWRECGSTIYKIRHATLFLLEWPKWLTRLSHSGTTVLFQCLYTSKSLSSASSRWCIPQQALWPKSRVSYSWPNSLPTVCQRQSIRSHLLLGDTFRMSSHLAPNLARQVVTQGGQSVKYRCNIARWLCSYHSLTDFKWPVNSHSKARIACPQTQLIPAASVPTSIARSWLDLQWKNCVANCKLWWAT